jgi:release factor glutamine methyltransferase
MKKIKDFISWFQLQSNGLDFVEPLDVFYLVEKFIGLKYADLILRPEALVTDSEFEGLLNAAKQRLSGKPLAYVIGEKYFFKDLFFVDENVLVPRPETELIVECALDFLNSVPLRFKKNKVFVDAGCGSGCIGLSIAKHAQNTFGVLVDVSEAAAKVASINKEKLKLDNIEIIECDFLNFSTKMSVDLIVANPPYIAKNDLAVEAQVKNYEPHLALFSEEEGFFHIRTWAQRASQILNPEGVVVFEVGSTQGPQAKKFFEDLNFFRSIEIKKDYAGKDRFILAKN